MSEFEIHGSHWACLGDENGNLLVDLLPQALSEGRLLDEGHPGPPEEGETVGIVWPYTPLGVLALIIGVKKSSGQIANELSSAYPFAPDGVVHELEIVNIQPWASGNEAWIHASFHGELGPFVSFFDTRFYANSHLYRQGMKAKFALSALAYEAEVGEMKPVLIENPDTIRAMRAGTDREGDESPIEVRFDNAAILLPTSADVHDDHEFVGPVKAVERFEFAGQQISKLTVTVQRVTDDDDREIDIHLYVDDEHWSGTARPVVGANVFGTLWLQGCLVP